MKGHKSHLTEIEFWLQEGKLNMIWKSHAHSFVTCCHLLVFSHMFPPFSLCSIPSPAEQGGHKYSQGSLFLPWEFMWPLFRKEGRAKGQKSFVLLESRKEGKGSKWRWRNEESTQQMGVAVDFDLSEHRAQSRSIKGKRKRKRIWNLERGGKARNWWGNYEGKSRGVELWTLTYQNKKHSEDQLKERGREKGSKV